MNPWFDEMGYPTLELRRRVAQRWEEDCAASQVENAELSTSGQTDEEELMDFDRKIVLDKLQVSENQSYKESDVKKELTDALLSQFKMRFEVERKN